MNILFLCHRLPFPPKRGGKIRPFNIIRHFSDSGHKVTVGSLARSEQEKREGAGLEDHCEKVLIGTIGRVGALAQMVGRLPTGSPSSMGYFYSRTLHRLVRQEAATSNFDLVFVHCSSAAQYARHVSDAASILDFGDMDSQKWLDYSRFRSFPLSAGYWLEGTKLLAAEKKLARQFDLSTCTTKAEFDTLGELNSAQRTGWFPNDVDAEYFSPGEQAHDPDLICFVGRMDYYPNQHAMQMFCDNVLPGIHRERPNTKLIIVGAEPSADIWSLGDRPGITVTGTVDDVRDYVRSAALTVAPLAIARGTQNKILESMALGVPVVSSTTAAGGVDAVAGQHIVTASTNDEYVESIVEILGNPEKRAKLAAAARDNVTKKHNWVESMTRLDHIVDSSGIIR